MNAFLNYLVEANLGLCLMLLMYVLFLRGETDFAVKRFFLLLSIVASVLFPLVQIEGTRYAYLPSLMSVLPTTWLPEVVVTANGKSASFWDIQFDAWLTLEIVYAVGLGVALGLFVVRLYKVASTLRSLHSYKLDNHVIFESDDNKSSFSFFRCIYIGQADVLSANEKAMIIHHEQIHSRQLHSLDILLVNLLGVLFWFNPLISIYKKTFIQLHEFEADARSVKTRDVDNYCSLLAKVALLSADIKLANHFSNSLTVKRIEMMRTIKAKIKRWKYVAFGAILPSFFFVVACQDQVMSEMTEVAKSANNAVLVPDHVQARYDELKKANPDSKVLLLDLDDKAVAKLQELDKQYGTPKSMEIFKPDGQLEKSSTANLASVSGSGSEVKTQTTGNGRTYAIVQYSATVGEIAERARSGDDVYTMVDDPAEYPGGISALMEFISSNLNYPEPARQRGIEGAVFVSFIVERDGSITSANVVKGLSPECDASALQVVEQMPKWIPGKHSGEIVRSRFVIPIKYKLAG